MSRLSILICCQAILSWIESYLISKISFIGKVGIATTHKEYRLLRSGWKTFLLLFSIQLIVIVVLSVARKKLPAKSARLTGVVLLVLAVLGLLTTYVDFQDTTHRWLKERFHLGFYLFWLSWIGSCAFFLATSSSKKDDTPTTWPEDQSVLTQEKAIDDSSI